MTLTAVDERFTSRVSANRAGRVVAIIEGHLTRLYQHNHRSRVAVPTSLPAGCNDDLLDHRFVRVIYLNNFLALPLNLEFEVGRIRKTCPSEHGRAHDSGRRRLDSRDGYRGYRGENCHQRQLRTFDERGNLFYSAERTRKCNRMPANL